MVPLKYDIQVNENLINRSAPKKINVYAQIDKAILDEVIAPCLVDHYHVSRSMVVLEPGARFKETATDEQIKAIIPHIDISELDTTAEMFKDNYALTEIDLSSWDMSNIVSCKRMFARCINLTRVKINLSKENLMPMCYQEMFMGCTQLLEAPELPAVNLAAYCYQSMFAGCESLRKCPALPATRLATGCYERMFMNSGVCSAGQLPATELADSCYKCMFYKCNGITSAPVLPAVKLKKACYCEMFANCRNLTAIGGAINPDAIVEHACYFSMFAGCGRLKEKDFRKPIRLPINPGNKWTETAFQYMFQGTGIIPLNFETGAVPLDIMEKLF